MCHPVLMIHFPHGSAGYVLFCILLSTYKWSTVAKARFLFAQPVTTFIWIDENFSYSKGHINGRGAGARGLSGRRQRVDSQHSQNESGRPDQLHHLEGARRLLPGQACGFARPVCKFRLLLPSQNVADFRSQPLPQIKLSHSDCAMFQA